MAEAKEGLEADLADLSARQQAAAKIQAQHRRGRAKQDMQRMREAHRARCDEAEALHEARLAAEFAKAIR